MSISQLQVQDTYVWGLVEGVCAKISCKFPEATFDIGVHPTHRGAIIDAHVPTDDDLLNW
ncbi:hypothetical protein [Candidatus Entotheonella palauensis]|uniref:Uncharacterized protein n=1 Tax=Candidatus Entotheonella gemina TaxID=1429439 RepID=W4M691_9BACT|nr:hypothetical protein [Candidatus Entotheonella palauensis]ETX05725.1 MAG: hypothetical protein ETSY2_21290 [Candidatus Entotheonella gemina]